MTRTIALLLVGASIVGCTTTPQTESHARSRTHSALAREARCETELARVRAENEWPRSQFKAEARKSETDLRKMSRAEAGRRMREMMEEGRRKNSATANAHPDHSGPREEFEKARAEWKAQEKDIKADQAWRAKEKAKAEKRSHASKEAWARRKGK
jgi:hypothetical protein